jgi:LacI family transcriptional regulator
MKLFHGETPDTNPFYTPVVAGIEQSCRAQHMDLMLAGMPVDQDNYPIEVPRIVTDRTCNGLIVLGVHLSQNTVEILRAAGPTVLVDSYSDDDTFDSVETDNVGGARTAVEHLVSRGHRSIAILATDPHAYPSILDRRRGYQQVITEAGLTPYYIDTPSRYWDAEPCGEFGVDYLKSHPEISAVFCANDEVAIALVRAARRAGISVPGQLSVVGYDDIDLAGFVSPALTTMAVDKVGMGRIAVTLLVRRLAPGKDFPTQTLIRPILLERETTRAVEPATRPEE